MRPLRQDVTGTIDASGNVSIPIKLPATGEWHELKIALSTSGPAEWAILVSGTAITYGRGRRVTLGPELIQDGETVTVTVTGGPPRQPIIGAVTGKSGTPEEMLASYGPQPNTIALDAAIPRQKLFPDGTAIPPSPLTPSYTVGNGATVSNTFTLPAGTVAVRVLVNASGLAFSYSLLVLGHQTVEQYWGSPSAPGSVQAVPTPTLPFTIPIENDWDSQLDFTLTNTSTATLRVFVSALFAPEAPGQAGAAQSVTEPTPANWQAPDQLPVAVNATLAAGAAQTLVAALTGATVRLFDFNFSYDAVVANAFLALQDTSGTNYGIYSVLTVSPFSFRFSGARLFPSLGVQVKNIGAAGPFTVRGHLTVSQS